MFLSSFQGTYDPAKVVITVADRVLTGFADGEFISVKFDEDRYFKRTGVDGEVSRIRNASSAGTIELTLMGTAPDNAIITELAAVKEAFPIGISDLSGNTQVFASQCWLKRFPDLIMSDEITDRTWVFDCADLQMQVAGNENNSLLGIIAGLF